MVDIYQHPAEDCGKPSCLQCNVAAEHILADINRSEVDPIVQHTLGGFDRLSCPLCPVIVPCPVPQTEASARRASDVMHNHLASHSIVDWLRALSTARATTSSTSKSRVGMPEDRTGPLH